MIIEEDVAMFLEHYGVKGQKWGVRKQQAGKVAKATGRGVFKTANLAVRGTKATARFAKAHPEEAGAIAAGAVFVGLRLRGKYLNARTASVINKTNAINSKRLLEGQQFIAKRNAVAPLLYKTTFRG